MAKEFKIQDPLVIIFRDPEKRVITRLHVPEDFDHGHYGMLVCDLVRHISRAMKIEEEAVWEWVDKERDQPTSEIATAS